MMIDKTFKKINKHYSNLSQYNYWKDGYIKIPINKTFRDKYLTDGLKNLFTNKEKNFHTKEKYKNVNQYDLTNKDNLDFCVQFLKDSDLKNILNFITCNDLILISAKIRINQNIKKMGKFWGGHRDTSILKDLSLKGLTPPSIILIYYPNLEGVMTYENQLRIWPGSHRKMFSHNLDKFFSFFMKKITIKTDDDYMLLFNGSLIHAIGYSNNPKGNLRLIFGFNNRHQFHSEMTDHDLVIRWNKILNDN